jgi:hypothetical protein
MKKAGTLMLSPFMKMQSTSQEKAYSFLEEEHMGGERISPKRNNVNKETGKLSNFNSFAGEIKEESAEQEVSHISPFDDRSDLKYSNQEELKESKELPVFNPFSNPWLAPEKENSQKSSTPLKRCNTPLFIKGGFTSKDMEEEEEDGGRMGCTPHSFLGMSGALPQKELKKIFLNANDIIKDR